MSVMAHMNERERRKVKDIDYKIVDVVGKPDYADESGLTPIRTRRLKAEDTNTTQEKAEMDDELDELDTEDDELGDLDTEDEEVINMEKEWKKLRAERKSYERKQKLGKQEEKKERLRQEIAAEKEKKRSKSKDKGEAFSKIFNLKDKYIKNNEKNVTIETLRKIPKYRSRASGKVNKILELCSDSDDSSSFVSSCSSNNFSDSENEIKKIKTHNSDKKSKNSDEVVQKQLWPQSKLQYEYAGSNVKFDELQFNLFVAGELEIISNKKTDEIEKTGRIKLLKKISYYTELHEWKGINQFYAHIIRQIENDLSTWSQDFSGVQTPLLIKYVKTDKARKPCYANDDKKVTKRDDTVFLLFPLSEKEVFSKLFSQRSN